MLARGVLGFRCAGGGCVGFSLLWVFAGGMGCGVGVRLRLLARLRANDARVEPRSPALLGTGHCAVQTRIWPPQTTLYLSNPFRVAGGAATVPVVSPQLGLTSPLIISVWMRR